MLITPHHLLSPCLTGIAPPQAYDDVYTFIPEGITVSPPGVLANDKADPSCPTSELRVFVAAEPEFGTATLHPDGSFTYKVTWPWVQPLYL